MTSSQFLVQKELKSGDRDRKSNMHKYVDKLIISISISLFYGIYPTNFNKRIKLQEYICIHDKI